MSVNKVSLSPGQSYTERKYLLTAPKIKMNHLCKFYILILWTLATEDTNSRSLRCPLLRELTVKNFSIRDNIFVFSDL